MSKLIKVKVKKTHPSLEGVFKVGDILKIKPIRYEKDTILVNEWWGWDEKAGEKYLRSPANIAPKGSVKEYVLVTADGQEWPGDTFSNAMGPNNGAYSNVFEKI